MKRPCKDCPFRSDIKSYLSRERRKEIADAIMNDGDFPCHKTFGTKMQYERSPEKAKRCIGAAIFLEHVMPSGVKANIMFRFALMFNEFTVEQLDISAPVVSSYQEFVNVE